MVSNLLPCCDCHLFGVVEAGSPEGTDCTGCTAFATRSVFAFLLLASTGVEVVAATDLRFEAFATTAGWLRETLDAIDDNAAADRRLSVIASLSDAISRSRVGSNRNCD